MRGHRLTAKFNEVIIKATASSQGEPGNHLNISIMKKVIYTQTLKNHLNLIKKTSNELAKEEPYKTVEQLLAEIEFVKNLLEESKQFIN